jgi:methylmalonyl-CoA/ethylmalonyl-CoA epimerase
MAEIKRIHHIAVLVDDLDDSLHFWRDLLGIIPTKISDMPTEAARIAFLPLADSEIELVQPTTADSGLSRYLDKHGPGMHHICLQVNGLAEMLKALKAQGVQLINEEPRIGDDGRTYAFIHPKSAHGVLVELYELADP